MMVGSTGATSVMKWVVFSRLGCEADAGQQCNSVVCTE